MLSFLSALGGAFLALRLDNPKVVVTERVVEVTPVTGPPELSEADLATLGRLYVEMTGEDQEWTLSLVHEISGRVCDGAPSAAEVLGSFGPDDISMSLDDFEVFVEQVRAACPA